MVRHTIQPINAKGRNYLARREMSPIPDRSMQQRKLDRLRLGTERFQMHGPASTAS